MSSERLAELYRELALHRVREAIDKLGQAPTDRLAAHSARARPCLMSGTAGAVVVSMCVLPHAARGAGLRR